MRRQLPTLTLVLLVLLLAVVDGWAAGPERPVVLVQPSVGLDQAPGGWCYLGLVTGYVRTEHGSHTYDGTPIWTDEPIAAAGWDIPINALVSVEDVGLFRVADRGLLGNGHIDVAVWTRSEAFAITGHRQVCVRLPVAVSTT